MIEQKTVSARAVIDVETMIRAFKLHSGKRTLVTRLVLAIGGVVAIIYAVQALQRGEAALAITVAVGGITLITLTARSGFQLRKTITKQLQQADAEFQEINYQFTDTHFRTESKEGDSNILWAKFRKWKEDNGLILVYRHDAQFIVVPIEQFEPDVQDVVRARLSEHVARV